MKKIFFLLIAMVCVAGVYAQNMQIWTDDDIMYEQSVATIDSITFTNANAPTQEGTLYKTWEGKRDYWAGVRITLTQNNTFTYYLWYENDDHSYSWRNFGSGTFLRQGNLILLCLTSGDGIYLPTCLVYNNGKLYGGFGANGSYEFQ
ncbi:MAG: hypothetical protein IJ249_01915 [Paludibacteraceae bacterium]|nr:hypothetical protein [Paludibacteraceae bacterium]